MPHTSETGTLSTRCRLRMARVKCFHSFLIRSLRFLADERFLHFQLRQDAITSREVPSSTQTGNVSAVLVSCASETLPQGFKVMTANVAKLAQWIVALARPGVNLLGSKIGLRVCIENGVYDLFCAFEHAP